MIFPLQAGRSGGEENRGAFFTLPGEGVYFNKVSCFVFHTAKKVWKSSFAEKVFSPTRLLKLSLFRCDDDGAVDAALSGFVGDFDGEALIFELPVDLLIDADLEGFFPVVSAFADAAA